MMQRAVRFLITLAVAVGAVPRAVGAQVYPERLSTTMKHGAAYQRRDRDDREEQTERTTKTVRLGSNGELSLGNIAGDITVTRGGGDDATIDVVKVARARSANEARELLTLVTVDVTERGGRAAPPPGGGARAGGGGGGGGGNPPPPPPRKPPPKHPAQQNPPRPLNRPAPAGPPPQRQFGVRQHQGQRHQGRDHRRQRERQR